MSPQGSQGTPATQAEPAPSSPGRGVALIILATFMFIVMDTTAKYLMRDYPVGMVVWGRYVFHVLLFVPLLLAGRGRGVLTTRRPWRQLLRSVLLLLSTIFAYLALARMQLAEVTAIFFVAPLLVTALSVPILGERVGARRWTAITVGFIGVLILVRPGSGVFGWAALLPLVTAACFALYQIVTRQISSADGPLTSLFYTALLGAVLASIAVPFQWHTPDAMGWVLLALAGFAGAAGHFFFITALTLAPASTVAPYQYVQIIWATLAGLIVFGNVPDPWTGAGAAVIAGSGLYVWQRERVRADMASDGPRPSTGSG